MMSRTTSVFVRGVGVMRLAYGMKRKEGDGGDPAGVISGTL
jgi:hypothetical protein